MTRAFYDTCVFVLAQNVRDPAYSHCALLVDPRRIEWDVALSCISRAEATVAEFIDHFLRQCAAQGVQFYEVEMVDIQAHQKANRGSKKRLEVLGVPSRDVKQIFAAAHSESSVLTARDEDFTAPSNKRVSRRIRTDVERLILRDFGIRVLSPANACAALCT